ncbi:DUF7718 family protein [Streptomyces sp. NPDC127020]|uniref:DUF7718 family protein n=1 Tax=Streptomyces sp. NPDC127020 TaxID=3347109 RepID=UPI003660C6D6
MANNSNKRRSKLANMGETPAKVAYRPPKVPPAEQLSFDIPCSEQDLLRVRLRTYRNKIVDFAVMQLTSDYGSWEDVARIDCCGGTIHRHLLGRSGAVLLDHDFIRDIPERDGAWDVVHDSYEGALNEMQEKWEDNLRRWRSG